MQRLDSPPTLPPSLSPTSIRTPPFSLLSLYFSLYSLSLENETPLLSLSSMSSPPSPSPFSLSIQNLGLGYAIAIAFGFLVLFSTVILSSYLCCRRRRRLRHPSSTTTSSDGGIIVPRIIFVAEDDDDEENQNRGGGAAGNGVVGLDRAVINSYPKFQFSKKNLTNSGDGGDNNNSMCSICLCDYKEGEMLRMMPDCKHYFHLCCLDAWLKLNGSCPVCRNSPLPTPISTPLAEVVPLSHYPDNRRRSTVISSS